MQIMCLLCCAGSVLSLRDYEVGGGLLYSEFVLLLTIQAHI